MNALWTLSVDFLGRHWEVLDALLVAVGLVIYVGASHSLHQRRHPSAAIAWVLGIVLLPFLTLPLYLAFGSRKLVASRLVIGERPVAVPGAAAYPTAAHSTAVRSMQLGMAMGLPDPVAYDGLCIHEDGGQALEALRRIIDSSSQTLDISTFVFGRDVLGDEIAERLKQRSRAGVRVRLMVDGIGIYLGGYPDLQGSHAGGRRGASLRVAVPFAKAWSHQSPQPPKNGHRGRERVCGAVDGICPPSISKAIRGQSCGVRPGSISVLTSAEHSPARR